MFVSMFVRLLSYVLFLIVLATAVHTSKDGIQPCTVPHTKSGNSRVTNGKHKVTQTGIIKIIIGVCTKNVPDRGRLSQERDTVLQYSSLCYSIALQLQVVLHIATKS